MEVKNVSRDEAKGIVFGRDSKRRGKGGEDFGDVPPIYEHLATKQKTKDYVEEGGGWTACARQARVFASGLEALFYCLTHNFADLQISGEFADSRMNFTMPVTDLRGG